MALLAACRSGRSTADSGGAPFRAGDEDAREPWGGRFAVTESLGEVEVALFVDDNPVRFAG